MDVNKAVNAFSMLGEILSSYLAQEGKNASAQGKWEGHFTALEKASREASEKNPWFILPHIKYALSAWAGVLNESGINEWLAGYQKDLEKKRPVSNVGVVMAGNIPLVGFHDFMCVLMSGNRFTGKLSSDDDILLPCIADILIKIEPELGDKIAFTSGRLEGFDAVIATGSNNTAAHFEYYFRDYGHIIRRNRNGVAVLTGHESKEDLSALADDIFLYFGLGCRNVSKIYIPEDFSLEIFKDAFRKYSAHPDFHKYRNNYDYYKSIFLVNGDPFFDAGNILLKEDSRIASPVSVLYFERYNDLPQVRRSLEGLSEQIQCIVSIENMPFRGCLPGKSQQPALGDYADGIDTMSFLLGLK